MFTPQVQNKITFQLAVFGPIETYWKLFVLPAPR